MKRVLVLGCLLLLILSAGCRRHRHQKLETYFWTSSGEGGRYHLFINGKDRGLLPYRQTVPDYAHRPVGRDLLKVTLRSGRYDVEVRNEAGEVFYEERLKLRLRGRSITIDNRTDYGDAGSEQVLEKGRLFKEIYF